MNFNEPVLFNESKAVALGYHEDLLPDLLWAESPRDLHNAKESDVFAYLWDDPEKVAQFSKEGRPCVVIGDWFYGASHLKTNLVLKVLP